MLVLLTLRAVFPRKPGLVTSRLNLLFHLLLNESLWIVSGPYVTFLPPNHQCQSLEAVASSYPSSYTNRIPKEGSLLSSANYPSDLHHHTANLQCCFKSLWNVSRRSNLLYLSTTNTSMLV